MARHPLQQAIPKQHQVRDHGISRGAIALGVANGSRYRVQYKNLRQHKTWNETTYQYQNTSDTMSTDPTPSTGTTSIAPVTSTEFYNLDAMLDIDDGDFVITSEHYQKQRMMRLLGKRKIDCTYHDVRFPPRSDGDCLLEYFKSEADGKAKDGLMVVYFHGRCWGNGQNYRWEFKGFPNPEIDAYQLIQWMLDSGLSWFLILDGFFPTNFHEQWKPTADEHGSVEILASGQGAIGRDQKQVEGSPGDFTRKLCTHMMQFANRISIPTEIFKDEETGDKYKHPGYKNFKAPISLNELLGNVKLLDSKPIRLWLGEKRTSAKKRVMIDPCHLRASEEIPGDAQGKYTFHVKTIPGLPSKRKFGAMKGEPASEEDSSVRAAIEFEAPVFVDEGYGEGRRSESPGLFVKD
ncbi:uncharacterized protein MYCFIDRAFT_197534 [Pseudocercospora fijiensis CIRAD86]|uniref:Uncharacterized protein n=1 Tax=Pseudocercospora fijiensis (strain CIRAD86) TaxID=383855 RepID=M2YXG9_PSEFD|nr:uncharacterized protein MYCFIDRAFT_197534 [Pseudocercospora fijiensis CIRAD86]EME82400.1 hypothetical protein MYCFIDRAFT_197534 [Pseudocercospora fijiensis CIRAD86]